MWHDGHSQVFTTKWFGTFYPCYPVYRPAFVNYVPHPEKMRQTIRNNQSRLVIHLRHTTRFVRTRKKDKVIERKNTEDQEQKETKRQKKTTFEPVAPVGGTSSTDMFYSLVGLVPCYSVYHLLPTFVHRGFPSTPPVAPPPPFPLGTTHGRSPALSTQLCLILVPPHNEPFGCFKDPPVPLPRHFCCSGPQSSLNPKNQGDVFR